jgi:hypothetical protein
VTSDRPRWQAPPRMVPRRAPRFAAALRAGLPILAVRRPGRSIRLPDRGASGGRRTGRVAGDPRYCAGRPRDQTARAAQPLSADQRPAVLVPRRGIGITPMLAMARDVARRGVPWRLVYGAATGPRWRSSTSCAPCKAGRSSSSPKTSATCWP